MAISIRWVRFFKFWLWDNLQSTVPLLLYSAFRSNQLHIIVSVDSQHVFSRANGLWNENPKTVIIRLQLDFCVNWYLKTWFQEVYQEILKTMDGNGHVDALRLEVDRLKVYFLIWGHIWVIVRIIFSCLNWTINFIVDECYLVLRNVIGV